MIGSALCRWGIELVSKVLSSTLHHQLNQVQLGIQIIFHVPVPVPVPVAPHSRVPPPPPSVRFLASLVNQCQTLEGLRGMLRACNRNLDRHVQAIHVNPKQRGGESRYNIGGTSASSVVGCPHYQGMPSYRNAFLHDLHDGGSGRRPPALLIDEIEKSIENCQKQRTVELVSGDEHADKKKKRRVDLMRVTNRQPTISQHHRPYHNDIPLRCVCAIYPASRSPRIGRRDCITRNRQTLVPR